MSEQHTAQTGQAAPAPWPDRLPQLSVRPLDGDGPERGDGRDPQGFAAVLQGLMADRAWEFPAAGGTVVDR
ncbi:hypothetical protein SSOG_07247 [Streptomyces himastatinicus ATCC 53653]|uniref:Uncharacterized protein n=1 Tax=Streptomyces himastatinicus ATCC 53653 TaxID=457427 RepID=D9WH53_9ACTN|nr:hypothetical protein [Streptomyces himastatinicus]EFL27533.1 hypothetical protein SSOG_07247 [Streptomyces himastatinicus ATCC 53653]